MRVYIDRPWFRDQQHRLLLDPEGENDQHILEGLAAEYELTDLGRTADGSNIRHVGIALAPAGEPVTLRNAALEAISAIEEIMSGCTGSGRYDGIMGAAEMLRLALTTATADSTGTKGRNGSWDGYGTTQSS